MIATFDPKVDAWLREVGQENYEILRDWLRVTWPDQIPPLTLEDQTA